jgi:hypothetical protein
MHYKIKKGDRFNWNDSIKEFLGDSIESFHTADGIFENYEYGNCIKFSIYNSPLVKIIFDREGKD